MVTEVEIEISDHILLKRLFACGDEPPYARGFDFYGQDWVLYSAYYNDDRKILRLTLRPEAKEPADG